MKTINAVLFGAVGLLIANGCLANGANGTKGVDEIADTDRKATHDTTTKTTRQPRINLTHVEQKSIAMEALANKLQVKSDVLSVVSIKSVVWSSGGLGCPEPGRHYTQALVPGRLIVLSDAEKEYRFHATTDGEPFYCPDGRSQSPVNNAAER